MLTLHSRRGVEGTPIVVEGDRFSRAVPLPREGFVRVELRKPSGEMLALTDAVYLP